MGRPTCGDMKTKDDLHRLGFSIAGTWSLDQKIKSGVRPKLVAFQKERVIYAFLVERVCKYIGICDASDTILADRVGQYEGMVGGRTTKRICGFIKDALSSGRTVEIMAIKPQASIEFEGLHVDLVRGLEYPLIQWTESEWNRRGKSRPKGIHYVPVSSLMPKER